MLHRGCFTRLAKLDVGPDRYPRKFEPVTMSGFNSSTCPVGHKRYIYQANFSLIFQAPRFALTSGIEAMSFYEKEHSTQPHGTSFFGGIRPSSTIDTEWTDAEEKSVRNRIDWHILPIVTLLYLLCFLDRFVLEHTVCLMEVCSDWDSYQLEAPIEPTSETPEYRVCKKISIWPAIGLIGS